jgi:hypothetical protein
MLSTVLGLVVLVATASVFLAQAGAEDRTLLYAAGAAGASGALVSMLIRLYRIDARADPLLIYLALQRGRSSLLCTPVLGALFAIVLFLVLRSGLTTTITLQGTPGEWNGISRPVNGGSPDHARLAAMMIWSFLAGWGGTVRPRCAGPDCPSNQFPAPAWLKPGQPSELK